MLIVPRFLLILLPVFAQFPSQLASASSLYRLDRENFSLRLEPQLRFIEPKETIRIMIKDWGNPAAHVMEQSPLGMIVDQSFPEGSSWGIVITASHDGHIPDKDALRLSEDQLLQALRKENPRFNKQRKAAGSAPVTSLDWALEPQYNARDHHITWAKELEFGRTGSRSLNYAVRILGRENAIHLNAVGPMDQLESITRSVQAVVAASAFDEGYRYTDFNPLYHRLADYGLKGLVAGPATLRGARLPNVWQKILEPSTLVVIGLLAFMLALGRWLTRRRLPEF